MGNSFYFGGPGTWTTGLFCLGSNPSVSDLGELHTALRAANIAVELGGGSGGSGGLAGVEEGSTRRKKEVLLILALSCLLVRSLSVSLSTYLSICLSAYPSISLLIIRGVLVDSLRLVVEALVFP